MAGLMRKGAGLLKGPGGGVAVGTCADCCPPATCDDCVSATDCSQCTGITPDTVHAAFDSSVAVCAPCLGGAGSSYTIGGAIASETYALGQSAGDACIWEYVAGAAFPITIDYYDNSNDCGMTAADGMTSVVLVAQTGFRVEYSVSGIHKRLKVFVSVGPCVGSPAGREIQVGDFLQDASADCCEDVILPNAVAVCSVTPELYDGQVRVSPC